MRYLITIGTIGEGKLSIQKISKSEVMPNKLYQNNGVQSYASITAGDNDDIVDVIMKCQATLLDGLKKDQEDLKKRLKTIQSFDVVERINNSIGLRNETI